MVKRRATSHLERLDRIEKGLRERADDGDTRSEARLEKFLERAPKARERSQAILEDPTEVIERIETRCEEAPPKPRDRQGVTGLPDGPSDVDPKRSRRGDANQPHSAGPGAASGNSSRGYADRRFGSSPIKYAGTRQ